MVLPRAESTATTLLAVLARGDDPPRGALDALGVGDRGAAELHHDAFRAPAENTIATQMEDSSGIRRAFSRTLRTRRRELALALGGLLVVAALAWLIFAGGDDGGENERQGAGATADPVFGLAADFTTEQLVDQVLLLGFDGTDGTAPFLAEARGRQLGGVLIRSENWFGVDQGRALVESVRTAGELGGPVPPLIVASQEGGPYRSFADLPPEQTELEIGDTGKAGAARNWAEETGEALRAAGFDLNLFPVADVATLDSPIADRAFSDDPLLAAELTAAAVRGCSRREARLRAAALPRPRRRLAGHESRPGDGQPRRGGALGARSRAVSSRLRRGRARGGALARCLRRL